MIVLGPMDADLNGAPPYWRTGNWRPNTRLTMVNTCAYATCPFDKCDLVFEYDARKRNSPMPTDQGWVFNGKDETFWKHDAERGALRFSLSEDGPSFWSFEKQTDPVPDRAVGYGLFLVEPREADARIGQLDFVTQASPHQGRYRGMRGSWRDGWTYRSLDSGVVIPMVQPTAVQSLTNVWHQLALDAELTGPNIRGQGIERNDGGRTIGSLDGILNDDPRRSFGYGSRATSLARGIFGKTEAVGTIGGWLRNYCASFPGRFVRAGFRAVALSKTTVLRLVFCAEAHQNFEPDTATFLVRYTSPSLGLRSTTLPNIEAQRGVSGFEAGRTVELQVELTQLVDGEEVWFTVERDWQHEKDRLRSTLHLLMVIVQEASL